MDINKTIRRRTIFIGIIITILFFLLLFNIFFIQSINAPKYKEQASNTWNSSYILEPDRGIIFDRNGERLAYNSTSYTVIAVLSKSNPVHIVDPVDTAAQLSSILNMSENDLYKLLTKDAYQVELRPGGWKINQDVAEKIKELKIPGIVLREEEKRYYPYNSFASYVLGFVNYENKGVLGIEGYYDEILSGTPGELNVLEDLKGYSLPEGELFFEPAKDGNDLVSTIDKTIQQYVESALDKAVELYNPKNVVVIVAEPNTGEILAMSNRPTYNPNEYWDIEDYKNPAINFNFEPGSTFKIITLAAAIEEGVFNPNSTFMSGSIDVYGDVIKDANNGVGWGEISYLEGVQRSSNVAFVKLGYEMLKKDKLFSYINDFGFGKKTGIDLQGESTGIMKKSEDAYPLDVATISFGQGIAVTPIQHVMAVSAVANGGNLITPHLVKEIRDNNTGEIISEVKPIIQSRVISEKTARETSSILEEVVKFGQKSGYIEGYNVAGKTGTAQKIGSNGEYLKNAYIASYIGYAPSYDPRLLVYVIVDEPNLDSAYYGSTVAAPIFTEIMQNSLRYLKVPKSNGKQVIFNDEKDIVLRNYTNKLVESSKNELNDLELVPVVIGDGKKILKQYPNEETKVAKGSRIYFVTIPEKEYIMPNLVGKSLREALEYCAALDIEVTFSGSGIVVSQSLTADYPYNGGVINITLESPTGE